MSSAQSHQLNHAVGALNLIGSVHSHQSVQPNYIVGRIYLHTSVHGRQAFSNNAKSVLRMPIGLSDTTLELATGEGSQFPLPTADSYFTVTLFTTSAGVEVDHEIVRVTGRRSGDSLIVNRGQEGTGARAWSAGTHVQLRITAATVDALQALVGEVRRFEGTTAPTGWMLCEGQGLYIADFPALFTVLGNRYGGDGVQTFALPMRKRIGNGPRDIIKVH